MKRKVVLRTVALISALVGLLIIVLSRNHLVTSRIAKSTLSSVSYEKVAKAIEMHATVLASPDEAFSQGDGGDEPPPLVYMANVRMTVEHPRSAFADDSFFVRVSGMAFSVPPQATLAQSKGIAPKNSSHPTSPSWSEDNIRLLFEGGCLGLTLSMPGPAVSPSGVVRLNGGVAEWIVMPAHSGNYKGLIQIVEAPCDDRSLVAFGKDVEQHGFDFISGRS